MSSTPIAKMVREMIARGVDPDVIELAITTAEQAVAAQHIPQNSADVSAERRREKDRLRKRKPPQIPQNSAEIPQNSETSLSKKERIEERKEEREPRKARASQLPDGWQPGENAWQAAVARIGEPRATAELQKFKNHAADKGRVSKRWDAAWQNWVDRALDYGGGMGMKGTSNGRRTVQDAARDLHEQTIAAVLAFDDPAPTGLRDGTGQAPLRLIPSR